MRVIDMERINMEREAFKELKAIQHGWKPIIDTYRSQLGDKVFSALISRKADNNTSLNMSSRLEKLSKKGIVPNAISGALERPSSRILASHMWSDNRQSYVSMLSSYIRLHREFRNQIRSYNTSITCLDKCAEMSVDEASRRVNSVWSGYGNSPIKIEACSPANPANSMKRVAGVKGDTFYVSKSFFRKAAKFPQTPIDSAAPIGIEEIEESDGITSARAWVFRQHLRRGIDSSYKYSVLESWIAYNRQMQISALHDGGRDAAIKLLKSRTIRQITKKLTGG